MAHYAQATNFAGLDLHKAPEDLSEGFLTQSDNLVLEGSDLALRPGLTGLFESNPAQAAYEPISFTDTSQQSWLVFTAEGKLWKSRRFTTTKAEIKFADGTSLAIDSANSRLTRNGKWGYLIDGSTDGFVYRFDLDSIQKMGTLVAPPAPSARLVNKYLIDCNDYTRWVADSGTSTANLLENPGFESGFSGWTTAWMDDRIDGSGHLSSKSCEFDNDYGSNIGSSTGSSNDRIAQLVTTPIVNGESTKHPRHYSFSMWGDNRSHPGNPKQVIVYLEGQDAIGNPIDGITKTLDFVDSGWKQQSFSWTVNPSLPEIIKVRVVLGQSSRYSGEDCLYIDDVFFSAVNTALSVSQAGDTSIQVNNHSEFVSEDKLVFTPTTNADWTQYNIVSVGFNLINPDIDPPRFRLVFTNGAGTPVTLESAIGTYTEDKSSFFFDISPLPDSVRGDIDKVALVLEDDLPANTVSGPLFDFGPVIAAGNLSILENDYTWLITEANPAGLPQTESPPSPASNSLTPNSSLAMSEITVPWTTNLSQPIYNVYRYGGTETSGLYRLVAQVNSTSDSQYGTVNKYVTWNHTTRVFTDNTPDEYLLGGLQLPIGADNPPKGAQSIGSWQNRLWLSVGSKMYGSWAMGDNEDSQLHFTYINSVDDPETVIKGATFAAGGADNDPIQAMLPFGTTMVVFKKRSVWLLSGSDPQNFTLNSYLINAGVGLIAPRAACIKDNQVWFLGPNGVNTFNASIVSPVSQAIDSQFPSTGDIEDWNPFRGAAMISHGYRLYLFMPDKGASRNNIAFVHDTRNNGWTKLLNQPVTSALSFGSSTGEKALYLAGWLDEESTEGQVFELSGTGDKKKPSAYLAPIGYAVTTRAYGRESTGEYYWNQKEAQTIKFHATYPYQGSLQLSVLGDNQAVVFGPKTYYTQPITTASVRCPASARGYTLQVKLTGACTGPARIKSLGLQFSEGYSRNG